MSNTINKETTDDKSSSLTEDGFDEEELRAALHMSMHHDDDCGKQSADTTSEAATPKVNQSEAPPPPEIKITTHPLENLTPFRSLMFNDSITTTDDKERWIYECISTEGSAAASAASPHNDGQYLSSLEILTGHHQQPTNSDSKPPATKDSHKQWGLTQKHGGPCGVLAAIQAEMIRILLFGRSDGKMYYPFYPQDQYAEALDGTLVKEALAMGIAMILARAAIMPRVDDVKPQSFEVCLVLPQEEVKQTTEKTGQNTVDQTTGWMSHLLHANTQNENKTPLGLTVYTLTCPNLNEIQLESSPSQDEDDTSPETKRRKKKGVSFANSNELTRVIDNNNHVNTKSELSPEEKRHQHQLSILAQSLADYLLGRSVDNNESVKSTSVPLDHFCGPGGIMFFVMSLVHSRGIEVVKSDMDDPNTTITSQFGHSSQELINLLLTGQAVSNVFDNSMTLSGELTCRGIQHRPTIGYLTQLESLSYCEVGTYYKSPTFPIWVIGSTSHFSVLFGNAACLHESQSDLLLERCRRAFKKAEDGGESGFISVGKFGEVVDGLGLREKVGGDHGVLALQAYLEVSGAGIILWEDSWKLLSRLLTGASLASIIGVDTNDTNQVAPASGAAASTSSCTMQSDEELAKKLAEEWGTSVAGNEAHVGGSAADSDEAYARAIQAQWDAELADSMDNATGDDSTTKAVNMFGLEQSDDDSLGGLGIVSGTNNGVPRPPTPPCNNRMGMSGAIAQQLETLSTNNLKEATPGANNLPELSSTGPSSYFEQYGSSFPLYHYNGLRGGTLTPFRVTRLNASEAVGSSIGLSSGASNHASDDLEAVVRTKWPSCTFDWLGKNAPYID